MIKCKFFVEACLGMPMIYENWWEELEVELTEEQFSRYADVLYKWCHSSEFKEWNDDNGHDFFIKRDLSDIYDIIWTRLKEMAPQIWDERINDYLGQINIFTADEIYDRMHENHPEEYSEWL